MSDNRTDGFAENEVDGHPVFGAEQPIRREAEGFDTKPSPDPATVLGVDPDAMVTEGPDPDQGHSVKVATDLADEALTNREAERPVGKPLTRWQLIARRFFRSKPAVFGLFGIAFIILFALLGPYVAQWDYRDVDNSAFLQPPSAEHWFGTGQTGRDLFALTVAGLRKSLIIGFAVAIIQTAVAALIGSAAAYFGKAVDKVILWVIDLLLVIPAFLLIAVITQRLSGQSASTFALIMLLAAFGWMLTARVVRSMTLSVASLDYVRAARYMSVPSWSIITKHILPNVSSYLIIDFTLGVVAAVMMETFLSYFGFGVQPPETSLGVLLSEGQKLATAFPWTFLAPATILVFMLICINFVGDGLRDAIDPSSKSGGQL